MNDDILVRYELAQKIHQGMKHNGLVRNDFVLPHWIVGSHCFWYKRATTDGEEYRLVDPQTASNKPLFDHGALASSLSNRMNETVDSQNLPIENVVATQQPLLVHFSAFNKHWQLEPESTICEEVEVNIPIHNSAFSNDPLFTPQYLPADQQTLHSPDGSKSVFIREHNLWIHDLTTGDEEALTEDGIPEYSYSSDRSVGLDTAVPAIWSPDSKYLFTVRRDSRKVVQRTQINYVPKDGSLRPQVEKNMMPLPGDEHVESYELAAFDIHTKQRQVADYPTLPLVHCGIFMAGFFRARLGWWSVDSRHAFFVHVTRGAKTVRVVKWDTQTGATHILFEEYSSTFVRLSHEVLDPLLIYPLPDRDELIWFSERSGWGHLYLYDLSTGKMKHPITEGRWLVRNILHYDAKRRELLIQTAGRDSKINPYYRDICKVNIDSGVLTPVISGCFEYNVYEPLSYQVGVSILLNEESGEITGVSPCGQYIVTTRSRVDTIPVTVLIDRNGEEILELETADVSNLPNNWQWPEPVKLKGSDGHTDIYGVVFRPPGFSPDISYPVVEYSNSTRIFSGFPQGSFINSHIDGAIYYLSSAIAALGFVVVSIDGRGAPLRDKAFLDHHYSDPVYTSDFEDRIAGIHQLAERYPYMDLERVGIVSPEHPTNAIYSLFKHPEFYKVCVQHCLTDPRFGVSMDEIYDGTIDDAVRNGNNYPENYVKYFSGKLLLIVGMTSTTAMNSSFRLVEAMQKANKDFDLLCMPNMHHEMTGYTIRREWDYLVTNLLGAKPPHGFQLRLASDIQNEIIVKDMCD